jgi:hypothetical protein
VLGPAHPQTRMAAGRLAAYYEAMHALDPSHGYDAEAARWRSQSELSESPEAGAGRPP